MKAVITRGQAQENISKFVEKMATKYTNGRKDLVISTMYNNEEIVEYRNLVNDLKNSK